MEGEGVKSLPGSQPLLGEVLPELVAEILGRSYDVTPCVWLPFRSVFSSCPSLTSSLCVCLSLSLLPCSLVQLEAKLGDEDDGEADRSMLLSSSVLPLFFPLSVFFLLSMYFSRFLCSGVMSSLRLLPCSPSCPSVQGVVQPETGLADAHALAGNASLCFFFFLFPSPLCFSFLILCFFTLSLSLFVFLLSSSPSRGGLYSLNNSSI